MAKKRFTVEFRESHIVTEAVWANSKAEAIRLVKQGDGERLDDLLDEERDPTSHKVVEVEAAS